MPTEALLYLHPNRINPDFSVFKLGTFAHQLSFTLDLNTGNFSGDYRIREKKASFHRNAWRDSLGYPLLDLAGNIQITEYQEAKARELIKKENAEFFPILNPDRLQKEGEWIHVSNQKKFTFNLMKTIRGRTYYGQFKKGSTFLTVTKVEPDYVYVRYGNERNGVFEIYEALMDRTEREIVVKLSKRGADFSGFERRAQLKVNGDRELDPEKYSAFWVREFPVEVEKEEAVMIQEPGESQGAIE